MDSKATAPGRRLSAGQTPDAGTEAVVNESKGAANEGRARASGQLDSAMHASYASQHDDGAGELEVPGGVVKGVRITQAKPSTKILAGEEQLKGARASG